MSTYPEAEAPGYDEKGLGKGKAASLDSPSSPNEYDIQEGEQGKLSRNLQGRHMQMIAIGRLTTA